MPLPTRRRDEKRGEFLNRCMANEEMNKEFPDSGQRFAVCNRRSASPAGLEAASGKSLVSNEKGTVRPPR